MLYCISLLSFLRRSAHSVVEGIHICVDTISELLPDLFQIEVKQRGDLKKLQEAFKFLIHLVGDIHQPLHSGRPRDRGGNDIKVKLTSFPFYNTSNPNMPNIFPYNADLHYVKYNFWFLA